MSQSIDIMIQDNKMIKRQAFIQNRLIFQKSEASMVKFWNFFCLKEMIFLSFSHSRFYKSGLGLAINSIGACYNIFT